MISPCRAKYITFDVRKYRGAISRDTEVPSKIGEKLTCGLKNYMRNFTNFQQNTWKYQNWDFDGTLLSKVENESAKITEELLTLKIDEKFEEELTCRFKIDIRNLTNFDSRTHKSQKLAF